MATLDHHDDGLLVQLGNQKKLFLSNEILFQEATSPLPQLEAVMARGTSPPLWHRRSDKENIEIYESSAGLASGWGELKEFSIVAKIDVKCHLMEVHNALCADDSAVYEALMHGLHKKKFKRGSLLHRFEDPETQTNVSVKTACFASGKLGKEIDYNFVDCRRRFPERKSVVHVTKSLPKEFHDRLAKNSVLGGAKEISTCCYAEQISASKTRIFFFATCTVDDESFGNDAAGKNSKSPSSSFSAMERPTTFLMKLALAMAQLESVVQRRRLGYQVFLGNNTNTKVAARGVKTCKVCDKSFGVLRLEHFCQLCGYRTCSTCSDILDVESKPGVLRSNRVCTSCVDAATYCVFDDDDLDFLGSRSIADFAVTSGSSFVQQQAELASTNKRIVVHKKRPNSQPDDEALKLIEYLFSSDPAKQATAMERFDVTRASASGTRQDPTEFVHFQLLEGLLRHALAHPLRLSVADCGYAEADQTREYLLNFEPGLRIAEAPRIHHEYLRFDLLSRLGLLEIDTIPSPEPFQVICEIAARVMDCRTAFVSVVGADLQHAVAHFNLALPKLPRRETICAYALTSERPFIVRNTLHDIRFRQFFCVARGGFQFYASFPIEAPAAVGGGGIVAGLVVVDREPKRVVTNRQYARMMVLTRVLSELLGATAAPVQ